MLSEYGCYALNTKYNKHYHSVKFTMRIIRNILHFLNYNIHTFYSLVNTQWFNFTKLQEKT